MTRRGRVLAAALTALIAAGALAPHAAATDRVTLTQLLGRLDVTAETNTGYDRDHFRHWVTVDGCSAREWVLIQEATAGTRVGCDVVGGRWSSRYDGRLASDPGSFDIDHMVPLAEAWGSGAGAWSDARRMAFANDLKFAGTLIAVSAASNRSKSDRDPAEWLPPRAAYRCTYLRNWMLVKFRWRLSVDPVEQRAIRAGLAGCSGSVRLPKRPVGDVTAPIPVPVPIPAPIPVPVPVAPASPTPEPVPSASPTSVTSSTARPGQFCKRADRGVQVSTASYGLLACRADPANDSYSRWYRT